jgi:hypothetical protein
MWKEVDTTELKVLDGNLLEETEVNLDIGSRI